VCYCESVCVSVCGVVVNVVAPPDKPYLPRGRRHSMKRTQPKEDDDDDEENDQA
jgi:hypothetical protein